MRVRTYPSQPNPFKDRKIYISHWRDLATADISPSGEVVSRARRINQLGFKPKDSIHLSCAIEAGCDIFLTTDTGILKKSALISDLVIINPVDYSFTQL